VLSALRACLTSVHKYNPEGIFEGGRIGREMGMAWAVIVVEPCLSWLHELRRTDRQTLIQISQAITTLAEEGPGLGAASGGHDRRIEVLEYEGTAARLGRPDRSKAAVHL
jgi:hypothetical protein